CEREGLQCCTCFFEVLHPEPLEALPVPGIFAGSVDAVGIHLDIAEISKESFPLHAQERFGNRNNSRRLNIDPTRRVAQVGIKYQNLSSFVLAREKVACNAEYAENIGIWIAWLDSA